MHHVQRTSIFRVAKSWFAAGANPFWLRFRARRLDENIRRDRRICFTFHAAIAAVYASRAWVGISARGATGGIAERAACVGRLLHTSRRRDPGADADQLYDRDAEQCADVADGAQP